jgi:hypothetical protein
MSLNPLTKFDFSRRASGRRISPHMLGSAQNRAVNSLVGQISCRGRAFSSVNGLATTRQHRCNGNCEILAAAETFGLTVYVTRNGVER